MNPILTSGLILCLLLWPVGLFHFMESFRAVEWFAAPKKAVFNGGGSGARGVMMDGWMEKAGVVEVDGVEEVDMVDIVAVGEVVEEIFRGTQPV